MGRVAYNSAALTAELRRRAEVELNEFESTKDEKIEEMRNLLEGKRGLKLTQDDSFLLQFLRTKKFDVPKAAKLCESYFRAWKTNFYQSIDYSSLMDKMEKYGRIGMLPYRDRSGCPILYCNAGAWDPDKMDLTELFQCIFVVHMAITASPVTQVVGFKSIFDYSGSSMRHILASPPQKIWEFLQIVQNALPGRYKEIHVLNAGLVRECIWPIVKWFMKPKVKNRIQFHGSNLEELHKSIPPEFLPEECGGSLGPLNNTSFMQDMRAFKKTFDAMKAYAHQQKFSE